MKKLSVSFLCVLFLLLTGCKNPVAEYDIAATTLPVYDFTVSLCQGTGLQVGRLITENVSCLHDYTLQVSQMQIIQSTDLVVISGAGLEEFLEDALSGSQNIIDASVSCHIHAAGDTHDGHAHSHDNDPHIWLSPENAKIMAGNICAGLTERYPEYKDIFNRNLLSLAAELNALYDYGTSQLVDLQCRELITFHDGFAYLAESFDLTILEAVEEESGSEASAQEIIHLITLVNEYDLPAVFTETNGSNACAGIVHQETGTQVYNLDMAMSADSYFEAMYHNIDTLKEALG